MDLVSQVLRFDSTKPIALQFDFSLMGIEVIVGGIQSGNFQILLQDYAEDSSEWIQDCLSLLRAEFPAILVYDIKNLLKKLGSPQTEFVRVRDVMIAQYLRGVKESDRVTVQAKSLEDQVKTIWDLGNTYLEQNFDQQNELWCIESQIAAVLSQMEVHGVFVDKRELQILKKELLARIAVLDADLKHKFGNPGINLNSTSQIGNALVAKGFKLKKSTSSGKISTDKNVLEELALTDETGLIAEILEHRTLSKLQSTFAEGLLKLLDEHSRVHTTFNQTQAATGRISSNDPNLQNIPIRHPQYGGLFRSCFAAPAGRCLVSADYSQVELRLLAHFSQDPVLIETFELNQDIHRRTAAEIFEIPLDEVTSKQRAAGKTLNFALVYQQGSFATARQLGISVKQAKEFIDKYFQRFPKVKPFVEETLEFARKNGFVETLYGRRRYFDSLNSANHRLKAMDERAAFNAVLQGSNADLIKVAMLELTRQIRDQNLDAILTLQVHDELVLECDESQAELLKVLLEKSMQPKVELLVPIVVEAGIGKNWNECK